MSLITNPPSEPPTAAAPTSGADCQVSTWQLPDDGVVPNNSRLPLVLYRRAVAPDTTSAELAERIEQRLHDHGWQPGWRAGVYAFRHYHSTAHEVLVVWRGRARLELGGEHGVEIDVEPGDALVLPAGVGHQCVEARSDFSVVGAYPRGQDWDLCRGRHSERGGALERIRHVALPARDPLFGDTGPLVELWGL